MANETPHARPLLQQFRVGEFGLQSFISGFLANSVSFMEEGNGTEDAEIAPPHLLQGDAVFSILLGDGSLLLLPAAPPPPPPPPPPPGP